MCLSVVGMFWVHVGFTLGLQAVQDGNNSASVFFSDSVTPESLKLAYAEANKIKRGRREPEKVKILVVPGHDAQFSGTEHDGLREVELNLELGEKLVALLKQEASFEVHLSQTKVGYTPEFSTYFEENRDKIFAFIQTQKGIMQHFVNTGKI